MEVVRGRFEAENIDENRSFPASDGYEKLWFLMMMARLLRARRSLHQAAINASSGLAVPPAATLSTWV
jgi:hypothetical protein